MDSTKRPKADSLAAMGLQRFTDDRYYKYGGYVALVAEFEAGHDNGVIARRFGRNNRGAVRPWRARWELENEHPELKQGGTLEAADE